MIIVADTSPLHYLVLIGEIHILGKLYDGILIPDAVHRELRHSSAPEPVRAWADGVPSWCEVRAVHLPSKAALIPLDPGEREAIQLALENNITTLLMDETKGRREALRYRLSVTGTIGTLEKAARSGLLDFHAALRRLEETSFRLSAEIREEFRQRNS